MYSSSGSFQNIVLGTGRHFIAKIKDGLTEVTTGIYSIKCKRGSNSGTDITFGSTYAGLVEVKVKNTGIIFENHEIEIFIGLDIDGTPEYIPFGKFKAIDYEPEEDVITFTAYDKMIYIMEENYFSSLTFPATDKQVLTELGTQAGITIDTTGLPNITINTEPEGMSYREVVGMIAQLHGKFTLFDRRGYLVFKWWTDINYNVDTTRYYDDLVVSDHDYVVGKVECSSDSAILSSGSGTTAISISNNFMTQSMLDNMFQTVSGFTFRQGSLSFIGDPRLDPYDMITVTDKKGKVCKIPMMVLTQDFDGGLITSVESYGKSETASNVSIDGPNEKAIKKFTAEFIRVKDLIANTITVDYLEANYVKTDELEAVVAQIELLEANSITVEYLTSNFADINLANIADGTIQSAMIGAGVIGTVQIADGSITDAKIVDLTANKLTAGTIDASSITVINLDCANLTVGTINGHQIAQGSITEELIANGAVTADKIPLGAIAADKLNVATHFLC